MNNKENISILAKEKCCGCHSCYNICPKKAISMVKDSEGFLYPRVSEDICINCGKCIQSCPGIKSPDVNLFDKAYACYAKREEEHLSSSSGGFFAVLAKEILQENGVICGAVFDDSVKVKHIVTDNALDLEKIKKTKYVQSTIGQAYSQIKEILQTKRKVLFSGTPCQVAGLKLYLGQDYDNLVCVDLICHGVPSPEVFARYILEKGGEHKVTAMSFRNKHPGKRSRTLDYWLDNGEKISESYEESPYIKGFIQNLYVRPSCFQCKYIGIERCSDITIGDFWSIDEFHPGFSNDKGTSAIILHSEKGIQMFEKIKDQLIYIKATSHEVGVWNSCIYKPVDKNPRRKLFFEKWNSETIAEAVLELQVSNKSSGQSTKKVSFLLEKLKRVLYRR